MDSDTNKPEELDVSELMQPDAEDDLSPNTDITEAIESHADDAGTSDNDGALYDQKLDNKTSDGDGILDDDVMPNDDVTPDDDGAFDAELPDDIVLPASEVKQYEPVPMGGLANTKVMSSVSEQSSDADKQAKATKKKSVLSQPIGASREKAFPTKTTMNLVQKDKKSLTLGKLVVFIVLAVVVLGFIGKFGIYDQYAAVSKAEKQTASLQNQLDALNASTANYDAVASQYAHYSSGYLNDDELSSVSRMEALDLVDGHIRSSATVSSVKISGNTMTVDCTDITLAQAGMIADDLKTQSIVSNVNLYTASLKSDNSRGDASFVIDLQVSSTSASQKS